MPLYPISISGQLNGKNYTRRESISYDNTVAVEKSGASAVAVAKVGQLTTRTDANTGTLTMVGGHGITTGAFLFLFWDDPTTGLPKGRRTIVGTVSVNSVPIDLGAGDDLPVNLTAVTACVAVPESAIVTGDNIAAIRFHSTRRGTVQLTDGSDAEHYAAELTPENGYTYIWYNSSGVTNPVAGDTVSKVKFGNGMSTGTNEMIAEVLYN